MEFLKTLISVITHPVIGLFLLNKGLTKFRIGRRIKCRRFSRFFSIDDGFCIGDDARLLFIDEYHGGSYSPFLRIGSGVNIGNRFSCLCSDSVTIGDRTLIASDVFITSYNHGMELEEYSSYGDTPLVSKPVKIGKGCWIGEKAVILPGVELGDRCIVGAGSIVSKSFPDRCIIGGVPAKILKLYNSEKKRWENKESV